jgi:catechol 2,3-dioxygenase
MDTLPLNLRSLSEEVNEEERNNAEAFSSGARIGHIHLSVTNLERSIKFYHEKLGLDITLNWRSMGAAFLSAGRCHHHIGMNTWHSLGGYAHNQDEVGLENFTITIADRSSLNTIRFIINNHHHASLEPQKKENADKNQLIVTDPDGIQIMIRSG